MVVMATGTQNDVFIDVQERQMSNLKWENVPTRTVDVGGVPFAYRELGPSSGVPVIFLHHLMAVLDDWDPPSPSLSTASPCIVG